ncbi:MAG: metallophosphoesterase [Chitinispirillales bacterium]|nr:metallophosphoesterase [Chitinispirillales bacterium]
MLKKIWVFILLSAILLGVYVFIEPYRIEDKIYYMSNQQIPGSFDGFRVIFITDIHHGPFFSIGRLKNLVRRVNQLKPDMVLLGGDYIHHSAKYIKPCFEELAKLSAPLGVYGVLGNHDHRKDGALTRLCMEAAGITSIDNAGVWIERGEGRIRVGGVGDLQTDWPDIDPALDGVTHDDYVIIVSHNPDFFQFVDSARLSLVDLALSGHTHGWQVNFFPRFTHKLVSNHSYNYRSGEYWIGTTKLIVSNGIGAVFLPVRFRARPQLVVVNL